MSRLKTRLARLRASAHSKRCRTVKQLRRKAAIPALLAFVSIGSTAHATERGMWIWQSNDIIDNTNGARTTLFSFCAAPHGTSAINDSTSAPPAITTLYLYCHAYIHGTSTQIASLRNFLSDAHSHNLKVQFLDGAPDWATTGKSYAETYLNYALQFNAGGTSTQRFDGIQYDVEPYLLSDWFSQATWDSYIRLLQDCQAAVSASGQGIRFGVCIPRWYDANPGPSYLLQVQRAVDYVAVMDYVDNPTSLILDIQNEMTNAAALGKQVVLGVETMAVTPSTTTFYEEGWGPMETELQTASRFYAASQAFIGTAVHHYPTYQSQIAGFTQTTNVSTSGAIPTTTTTSTTTKVHKRR